MIEGNDINTWGVLIGAGGLALTVFTLRYNNNSRRIDRREKELEGVIEASLNKFKIDFIKELGSTFLSHTSIAQIKIEIMSDVSEHYVQKDTWEQHNRAEDNRYKGVDEAMKGLDHRVKRNSQNIYMATDNMFDIMSKVGMRRKGPRHVDEEAPSPEG